MKSTIYFPGILLFFTLLLAQPAMSEVDPGQILRQAIEYWRGKSSYAEASMVIHRPEWERKTSLHMWTSGNDNSLVRFVAPARDAGNASLTLEDEMWSFAPRINRIIKIPSSMMNQSWMGSDFSYNDLSKADEILEQYQHRLLRQEEHQGKKVRVIEAVPNDDAPVVWGKEILWVREDQIMLRHEFYDQDFKLVKRMQAEEIKQLGGRLYATRSRMENLEKEEHWTEVIHTKAEFDIKIPDSVFTLANLRNPRERKR